MHCQVKSHCILNICFKMRRFPLQMNTLTCSIDQGRALSDQATRVELTWRGFDHLHLLGGVTAGVCGHRRSRNVAGNPGKTRFAQGICGLDCGPALGVALFLWGGQDDLFSCRCQHYKLAWDKSYHEFSLRQKGNRWIPSGICLLHPVQSCIPAAHFWSEF